MSGRYTCQATGQIYSYWSSPLQLEYITKYNTFYHLWAGGLSHILLVLLQLCFYLVSSLCCNCWYLLCDILFLSCLFARTMPLRSVSNLSWTQWTSQKWNVIFTCWVLITELVLSSMLRGTVGMRGTKTKTGRKLLFYFFSVPALIGFESRRWGGQCCRHGNFLAGFKDILSYCCKPLFFGKHLKTYLWIIVNDLKYVKPWFDPWKIRVRWFSVN